MRIPLGNVGSSGMDRYVRTHQLQIVIQTMYQQGRDTHSEFASPIAVIACARAASPWSVQLDPPAVAVRCIKCFGPPLDEAAGGAASEGGGGLAAALPTAAPSAFVTAEMFAGSSVR